MVLSLKPLFFFIALVPGADLQPIVEKSNAFKPRGNDKTKNYFKLQRWGPNCWRQQRTLTAAAEQTANVLDATASGEGRIGSAWLMLLDGASARHVGD